MIQTSYFGARGLPIDSCVAISRGVPRGWKGRDYLALAPSRELLTEYKAGRLSWRLYEMLYREQVLDRLDPMDVASDLTQEGDVILCCWEREREHCHRRLVAEWLSFIEPVAEWVAPGGLAGRDGRRCVAREGERWLRTGGESGMTGYSTREAL